MSVPVSDVWEVMSSARGIRRFNAGPVDDLLLARCLEAATWAPSGGNQQPWRFIVMKNATSRSLLEQGARHALRTIERVYGLERPAPHDDSPRARNARPMFALHDGAADVPAAVLFCVKEQPSTPTLMLGASIFPAMQNFLLAVRASGLGACVTGWHADIEPEIRATLGIPDDWQLAALVVVGWPEGQHGPVRRRPVSQVASLDHWDTPLVAETNQQPLQ